MDLAGERPRPNNHYVPLTYSPSFDDYIQHNISFVQIVHCWNFLATSCFEGLGSSHSHFKYVFALLLLCAGVDVWLKLHARLIAVIPGLNQTAKACKKKFNGLFKQYKEDKLTNGISGSDRRSCKYYDSFDQWWHQIGTVMKHVTASANNSTCVEGSKDEVEKEQNSEVVPTSSLKSDSKKSFQEQCFGVFMQMAENSTTMVKNFEKTNVLLEKVERQMDRLIDKL